MYLLGQLTDWLTTKNRPLVSDAATFAWLLLLLSYCCLSVCLCVQEYIVPDVRDREFLAAFHRQAEKQQLDVTKYDELRDKIRQTEYDLHRLRDPLHLDLPAEYLDTLSNSQAVRPAYADPLT